MSKIHNEMAHIHKNMSRFEKDNSKLNPFETFAESIGTFRERKFSDNDCSETREQETKQTIYCLVSVNKTVVSDCVKLQESLMDMKIRTMGE